MIKQLQRRFIRIAVVALTVAMVLVVGIVNVANWISVRGELFSTLSLIVPPDMTDEIPAAPVILPSEPAETAPPAGLTLTVPRSPPIAVTALPMPIVRAVP